MVQQNGSWPAVARVAVLVTLFTAVGMSLGQGTSYGEWGVLRRVDPISDVNNSAAMTFATDYPVLADNSMLFIRCWPGSRYGVEIYVDADDYLATEQAVFADYRFDDRQAHVGTRWWPSTDGVAAFLPESEVPYFVEEMLVSDVLYWRVYDYAGTGLLYTFSMDGFYEALEALGCYVP